MKSIIKKKAYPLDSSAIYHLGSMSKKYMNTFRITVKLKEKVQPAMLQEALRNITPRFPAIVAGIKEGFFNYYIVPSEKTPEIEQDTEYMAYMPAKKLKDCAIRILYDCRQISMEFFHAITDGHGAMTFIKSLAAEYISLKHSVAIPYSDDILNPQDEAEEQEVVDDYVTYKGKKKISAKRQSAFRLPKLVNHDENVLQRKNGVYNVSDIIDKAHQFGVSVTTFLTSVSAKALLEVQKEHMPAKKHKKPVRIMVPINLRKKFSSKTLRNFSLYAMPCVEPEREDIAFEELIKDISAQMGDQFSEQQLRGMMATNVASQRMWAFKYMPLPVKKLILKIVFYFYGERSSCITVSNLGDIKLPEEMKEHVEELDLMLNPRKVVPHNCGVYSYNGKLHINFTRKGTIDSFEKKFFEILESC